MVVKYDLGFRLGVFLLNDELRLMGLEPVVGFINFNYMFRGYLMEKRLFLKYESNHCVGFDCLNGLYGFDSLD